MVGSLDMILKTTISFTAYGEQFFPSKVDAPFTEANDPGDLYTHRARLGQPIPYGSACFYAPEGESEPIAYLHRLVVPLLGKLKEAGADDFSMRITYVTDSGSLGFSKEDLRMIAELECDLPIDVYCKDDF